MKKYVIPQITEQSFKNPVTIVNKGKVTDTKSRVNGDPFVMKYNGEYFCYSTGNDSVNILYSQDLIHFEHLGGCLQDEGRYDFWAPCVIYLNGLFYMYYSSNPIGESDDHAHCLRVAVSESPYGPFVFQKQLLDLFSIDPHVIKDDNGRLFVFYSANNYNGTDRNFTGTIVLVDEMSDPLTLVKNPLPVIVPSIKEEMFMKNRFGDGRDWYTIEGAFYLKKRQTEYLMYSANAFTNPTYFIGYSSASGNGLIDFKWDKYPNDADYDPFICQNNSVIGTGHNSVVKAPNNVDDWIVYHGNDSQTPINDVPMNREMRIDPLIFGDNRLYTIAPSTELIDAPTQPLYRNLYHEGLKKEVCKEGEWRVELGCLQQNDRNIISRMYLEDVCSEDYILEVNMRWHSFHLGGRFGIFAAYLSNQNNVQVILNEGEHTVELYAVLNGCRTQISSVKLDKEFDFKVYHKVTIKRTAEQFLLYVDDIFLARENYNIGRTSVGFITYYTGADFASIELTEYLELNQTNVSEFVAQTFSHSDTLEKNWVISGNGITGYAIDSYKLLITQKRSKYRFSVNVEQMIKEEDKFSGVYAAYYDDANYTALLFNTVSNKIFIRTKKSGIFTDTPVNTADLEMCSVVTVIKYKEKMCILIGADTIMEDRTDAGECLCGLYAGTRTVFKGIELLTL